LARRKRRQLKDGIHRRRIAGSEGFVTYRLDLPLKFRH
jgi:hypothetical protein